MDFRRKINDDEVHLKNMREWYDLNPDNIEHIFTSGPRRLTRSELLKRCPPYEPTGCKTPRQWINEFYHEVLITYTNVFERAYWFVEFMAQGDFTYHLEEGMSEYVDECYENDCEPSLMNLAREFYAEMWTEEAQRARLEEFNKSDFDPLGEISMQRYIKKWLDILEDITLSERGDPIALVMGKLPAVFRHYVEVEDCKPTSRYELAKIAQRFFEQKGYDWSVILLEHLICEDNHDQTDNETSK